MTVAPVGIRCPDHGGTRPRAVTAASRPATVANKRVRRTAARHGYVIPEFSVTRVLVVVNVLVYLAELAKGGNIDGTGNSIFINGALYGPAVAHGDWWRLFTAAFLHYGPIHLALNMLALWWLGQPVEAALGRARFLLLYVVAGAGRLGGGAAAQPAVRHRRGVGRDLRNPRRAARPRVPGHRIAGRAGDDADRDQRRLQLRRLEHLDRRPPRRARRRDPGHDRLRRVPPVLPGGRPRGALPSR